MTETIPPKPPVAIPLTAKNVLALAGALEAKTMALHMACNLLTMARGELPVEAANVHAAAMLMKAAENLNLAAAALGGTQKKLPKHPPKNYPAGAEKVLAFPTKTLPKQPPKQPQ